MSADAHKPSKIASRNDRQAFWREVMNDEHAETQHRSKACELLRASVLSLGSHERGDKP